MLLYVTMDGCTYCTKMVRSTLSDPEVRKMIGASYVAVAIKNSDRPDLMRKLQIRSFPTTLLVSPDGRILNQMKGYVDARRFQRQLADVASPRQARAATQTPAPVQHKRPAPASRAVKKPAKSGWSLPFGLGRTLGPSRPRQR
jgi:thioredoxin-related protein